MREPRLLRLGVNEGVLARFVRKSFLDRKAAAVWMIVSVAAGTAVAASLLTISFEISGKVASELRAFGANIVIDPKVEGLAGLAEQPRTLREADLVKVKTIFWRHNILGLAPFLTTRGVVRGPGGREAVVAVVGTWYERELPLPGEAGTFRAGVKTVAPWWTIEGEWPEAAGEVLLGVALARKLGAERGATVSIDGRPFTVSGQLETGGEEDDEIVMDLGELQKLRGLEGQVSKVLVSALTAPMDDFAAKDPAAMSPAELEKWYCTAYVTSIARQLEAVFAGASARPIWRIADTEGRLLEKLGLLIHFLVLAALAAAVLGVATTFAMSLLRRAGEIALMKAMGAGRSKLLPIFLLEGLLVGLLGGVAGSAAAVLLAGYIGRHVFQSGFDQRAALLPVAVGCAILVSLAGTVLPVVRVMRLKPAEVLRGGA